MRFAMAATRDYSSLKINSQCQEPLMSDMSPIARLLIAVLRWGSMAAAGLLLAFLGIFLWQRHTPEGFVLNRQDYGFMSVVVALLLLAFYLIRAIRRELDRHAGSGRG
jgi:hypothetical protein